MVGVILTITGPVARPVGMKMMLAKMNMQQPSFINLVFVKRLYNDGIVM